MKAERIVKRLFKGYVVTLAGLTSRILAIVDIKLANHALVSISRDRLSKELATLNSAIGRVRRGEFSAMIAEADEIRNKRYRAFALRVEADTLRTEPAIVDNALRLFGIIAKNRKDIKQGYHDQTDRLENLFTQMDMMENTALIESNDIRPIYDNLVAAQQAFRAVWTQSVEKETTKEDIPHVRDAADAVINTLNRSLFGRLDIGAEDEGDPFVTAIAMINEAIHRTHQVQRSRIARSDTTDEPVSEAVA